MPDDPTTERGEINSLTYGDIRVQLLSDTLVRIEQKGPKGFEDRASYIVNNRDNWTTVTYTQEQTSDEYVIRTRNYLVRIPKNSTAESVYVTTPTNKLLYKYDGNTETNVYLPSPSEELKSWYFTDSPRIIPSSAGYSVNGEPLSGWDFDNDSTDIFVFLPGGDYKQFTKDYTRLTGESEMVTLQTLGYWDSRYYEYTAESALQQINDYLDRGYSIDVLVIDTDWRDHTTGLNGVGYDVNTDLFPDMAGFLKECHDKGVNVCFNDHPEPVSGTTNGLDEAEVDYRSKKLKMILSLGIDYWWYDR
ncbi:MAG TPA: hypothetical protein DDY82_02910, partial [Clostridiales bacterium]|nr:hypothetical protein [Clostridiales bacterium]